MKDDEMEEITITLNTAEYNWLLEKAKAANMSFECYCQRLLSEWLKNNDNETC